MSFTEFYWVLLGFTGFYWVLLGFTGFYWVLPGFTKFYGVFMKSYWVLLGFTGFSWVARGETAVGNQTEEDRVDVDRENGARADRQEVGHSSRDRCGR